MATGRIGGEVITRYKSFYIDDSTITYSATEGNSSAQAGERLAVSLSADETVQLAADGESIVGRLEKLEKDVIGVLAVVAVEGVRMRFKGGASATLTRGVGIVGALGASSARGYVRSPVAAGGTYAQAAVNEAARARGVLIDDDATDPVVMFNYA